jgi:hypothetical protein
MTNTTQEQKLWFSSPDSVQLWMAALDQKRQAYKFSDFFLRYLEGLINYIDTCSARDSELLGGIPRVVVQISALTLKGPL